MEIKQISKMLGFFKVDIIKLFHEIQSKINFKNVQKTILTKLLL